MSTALLSGLNKPIATSVQLEGTTERPRLAIFRSNEHMYAQVRVLNSCHCPLKTTS